MKQKPKSKNEMEAFISLLVHWHSVWAMRFDWAMIAYSEFGPYVSSTKATKESALWSRLNDECQTKPQTESEN